MNVFSIFKILFVISLFFLTLLVGALSYRYKLVTYDFIQYLSIKKNILTPKNKSNFKPHKDRFYISVLDNYVFGEETKWFSKHLLDNIGMKKNVHYIKTGEKDNYGIYLNNKLVKKVIIENKELSGQDVSINQFLDGNKVLITNIREKYVGLFDLEKNKYKWKTFVDNPHHWSKANDEYVYVNTRVFNDLPKAADTKFKKSSNLADCIHENVMFDQITILDIRNGAKIKIIDLFEIISKNDNLKNTFRSCNDPFHNNHIEPINEKIKINFRNASKNDFLISVRNLNLVAHVSFENEKIEWFIQDIFDFQHSPVLDDNFLYVFDNLGGTIDYGRARILKIDVNTKKIIKSFDGDENFTFTAKVRGRIFLNENFPDSIFVFNHVSRMFFEINKNTMKIKKIHSTDWNSRTDDIFYVNFVNSP